MQRWSPGDTVVWRSGHDGKVWSAYPMTVVRDTPDFVAPSAPPHEKTPGADAVERVLRRAPPLDEPWERWRPDRAWPLPVLPDGWDRAR